jgi:hypothetical protein
VGSCSAELILAGEEFLRSREGQLLICRPGKLGVTEVSKSKICQRRGWSCSADWGGPCEHGEEAWTFPGVMWF